MADKNKIKLFFIGKYLTYGDYKKEIVPTFSERQESVRYIISNPTTFTGKQHITTTEPEVHVTLPIVQNGEFKGTAKIFFHDFEGNAFSEVVNSHFMSEIKRLQSENNYLSNRVGDLLKQNEMLSQDVERITEKFRESYKKWRQTAGYSNVEGMK